MKEDKEQKQIQERKEELREKIDQIVYILVVAKQCLLFSKDLRFSDDEKLDTFLKGSGHFTFIHTSLWKQCVVELAKLFSKSEGQKFNVHRLMTQLGSSGHFGCLGFDKGAIQAWQNRITENQDKIEVILKLRDKVYAHTDPGFEVHTLDVPTFKDIEQLIQIVEQVVQEVNRKVFNTTLILEHLPHYDDRFVRMLKELVEYKEQKLKSWFIEKQKSPFE